MSVNARSSASRRKKPLRRLGNFESLESRQMLTYVAQIGGADADYTPNNGSKAVDDAGNTYVGGWFEGTSDFDPGPGTYSLASEFRSAFVAKYDADGELLWARAFDADGKKKGRDIPSAITNDIAVDSNGSLYAIGHFDQHVDLSGSGSYLTNTGGDDMFIARLDSATGVTTWAQSISGSENVIPNAVATADGYLYATGSFSGTADFDPGNDIHNITSDDTDGFVISLETSGEFVTAWNFGGADSDRGTAIVADGDAVFVGGTFRATADFDPTTSEVTRTSAGSHDSFFASFSTSGALNWVQSIGSTETDSFSAMVVDDTNLIVAARFRGNVLDVDPSDAVLNLATSGDGTGFVAKYSKTTGLLDAQFTPGQFGGNTSSDGVLIRGGVTLDASGGIYIGLAYQGTIDVDPGPAVISSPAATSDLWGNSIVVKLDADGNYSKHWYSDAYTAQPVRVSGNTVYIVGNFVGTATLQTGDTVTSSGDADVYLLTLTMSQPPTADAGVNIIGDEDQLVSFDGSGSGSTDPEGDTLTYIWDFGDGQTAQTTNPLIDHTYAYGGQFEATLTVSDGNGNQATDVVTATITEVNDAPTADAGGPYNNVVASALTFDASDSFDFDNLDGTSANDQTLEYAWDFGDGHTATTFSPTIDHTYDTVGTYPVTLTLSDGKVTSVPAVTSAVIETAPSGDPNTIYVWDVEDTFQTRQRGRKNTDHRVVLTVRQDSDANGIAESSDDVIANVQVRVELRDSSGNLVTTLLGTTDSTGEFRSDWIRGLHPGNYHAQVVDLAFSAFAWDPLLDVENDQLLTV